MANAKSRLKAPKSASKKTKKRNSKTKESSTGLVKTKQPTRAAECSVVMKRPITGKDMTADEKVQYILQNGHKLKDKYKDKLFIKQPAPPIHSVKYKLSMIYERNRDTDLPLNTKSGRLKKKKKCNMELLNSILRSELMINDSGDTKKVTRAHFLPAPPASIVINNNDNAITDQNTTLEVLSNATPENIPDAIPEELPNASHADCPNSIPEVIPVAATVDCPDTTPEDICDPIPEYFTDVADNFANNPNLSNNSIEKVAKKKKKDSKGVKKKYKPEHVNLGNGIVLSLPYFECDYCQKTFNKKCSLARHIMMHLGMTLYRCPRCPLEFRSLYNMQLHAERYHKPDKDDPDIFVCSFCAEPFLLKENLQRHVATHLPNECSFKCIFCHKTYPSHIALMKHEKKHLVKGRYQCTLCSMSYSCRLRLYDHIKSHIKLKEFICQYCGKDFLSQTSMTRHLEVHHGGYRIVCPICKKRLKGHLTEHMRTHEKKRPHICPECGQQFTQSTQLTVHRRAHTGARPYPCRICNRLFSHSNALMLHIRRHTGEKPFPCAMCPMSFSQLPHMKTHMSKIHGKENPYKCSNCDSFFKLKAQLDVHESKCSTGKVDKTLKGKNKKSKDSKEIEVAAPMTLSRMRFLLALLLTMIATKERLKYLGA